MKVLRTGLPEVLIVEPRLIEDARGWFFEEFRADRFIELGLPGHFPQENQSRSVKNVLRGLHYQLERPQGKLVTCTQGIIFDVAVDIRRGSPRFGKWVGIELRGDSPRQVWIPPGFAHGFCALSQDARVAYKCTDLYVAADDRGIPWNDPDLAIHWPVREPLVSDRDQRHSLLCEKSDLPEYDWPSIGPET